MTEGEVRACGGKKASKSAEEGGLCSDTCAPEQKRAGIGGKRGPLEKVCRDIKAKSSAFSTR